MLFEGKYEFVSKATSNIFFEMFDNFFELNFSKIYFISFPLLLVHISMDNPFSAGSYKPANLISFIPNELLTIILLF